MHGGGFVSLSSRMMQSMTRRWAKKLKVPIFSIDYRKPPQNPFPAATNDCLAVYRFVLDKVSHYFNIEPTKVYLVGDSAGGNLACSLMGSILIYQLPLPKGIYLAYPTIDIRSIFSPSKVNSLMDPLLWPSMLNLILKEYLGGKIELQSHPLVSPLLLTEAYVGGDLKDLRFPLKWPKTFISTGQKDTFYDNSLILMQKLK
jgi:acetyl esterase/lipase